MIPDTSVWHMPDGGVAGPLPLWGGMMRSQKCMKWKKIGYIPGTAPGSAAGSTGTGKFLKFQVVSLHFCKISRTCVQRDFLSNEFGTGQSIQKKKVCGPGFCTQPTLRQTCLSGWQTKLQHSSL